MGTAGRTVIEWLGAVGQMAWRLVLSDAWPGDTAADEPELTLFNGLLAVPWPRYPTPEGGGFSPRNPLEKCTSLFSHHLRLASLVNSTR
jgi:hypothetical protein